MSVIVKGMEMPENCCQCIHTAWDGRDDVCRFSGISALNIGRQSDCPIVEVPQHGRLIDADAFFKDVCNSIENMTKLGVGVDADFLWAKLNDALDNAPTVIPADKDGET